MQEPFYEVLPSQTRNWNPLYSVDITSVMSNKVELLRKYACQNPGDSIVREKLAQAEQRGRERLPQVRYAETFTTFDGKPWPGILEKLQQTVRRLPDSGNLRPCVPPAPLLQYQGVESKSEVVY